MAQDKLTVLRDLAALNASGVSLPTGRVREFALAIEAITNEQAPTQLSLRRAYITAFFESHRHEVSAHTDARLEAEPRLQPQPSAHSDSPSPLRPQLLPTGLPKSQHSPQHSMQHSPHHLPQHSQQHSLQCVQEQARQPTHQKQPAVSLPMQPRQTPPDLTGSIRAALGPRPGLKLVARAIHFGGDWSDFFCELPRSDSSEAQGFPEFARAAERLEGRCVVALLPFTSQSGGCRELLERTHLQQWLAAWGGGACVEPLHPRPLPRMLTRRTCAVRWSSAVPAGPEGPAGAFSALAAVQVLEVLGRQLPGARSEQLVLALSEEPLHGSGGEEALGRVDGAARLALLSVPALRGLEAVGGVAAVLQAVAAVLARLLGIRPCVYFQCLLNWSEAYSATACPGDGASPGAAAQAVTLHTCPVCLRKLSHALPALGMAAGLQVHYGGQQAHYRGQKWPDAAEWCRDRLAFLELRD